jgi:hypothetical protein
MPRVQYVVSNMWSSAWRNHIGVQCDSCHPSESVGLAPSRRVCCSCSSGRLHRAALACKHVLCADAHSAAPEEVVSARCLLVRLSRGQASPPSSSGIGCWHCAAGSKKRILSQRPRLYRNSPLGTVRSWNFTAAQQCRLPASRRCGDWTAHTSRDAGLRTY